MAYKTTEYSVGPDILAGVHGLRSPVHRTIDLDYIAPDGAGRKFVPAGTFFADLGDGYARPLPRALVGADTGTGTAVIPVNFPQVFVAGDVLRTLIPSSKVTIASSSTGWTAGDTITVTIAGQAFVYTVLAEDIAGTLAATNALIASKVAALLTAQAANLVTAAATAAIVNIASATGEEHTLTSADTGTNGTATAGAATLTANQAVGTVLSVDPDAGTVTLAANNATALLAGQAIGTRSKALGLIVQSLTLDGQNAIGDAPEQGFYTSVSVRRDLLPYYDALIKADLPEVQAV